MNERLLVSILFVCDAMFSVFQVIFDTQQTYELMHCLEELSLKQRLDEMSPQNNDNDKSSKTMVG